MSTIPNNGKFPPASRPAPATATIAPATKAAPAPASNRWRPALPPARTMPNAPPHATPGTASKMQPQSGPLPIPRPPRPLASIELFQKAQALLLALPAQPPVLRKEGVELIAALGTGYLNGDAASLIPALNETRARCGRLLALLTALCPAQLTEFDTQLHGLHRACGYFVRYLQEQQRMQK